MLVIRALVLLRARFICIETSCWVVVDDILEGNPTTSLRGLAARVVTDGCQNVLDTCQNVRGTSLNTQAMRLNKQTEVVTLVKKYRPRKGQCALPTCVDHRSFGS